MSELRAITEPTAEQPALPHLRPDAFSIPYRDPVWNGPTDPVLVADHLRGEWVLFYTSAGPPRRG